MSAPILSRLRLLGPGLILAAAGIGAGDVVIASVTGIRFGSSLLWAIVATVALKFVLTEALARWQLATGETVVRAWVTRMPRWVRVYFAAYLLLWTFMVGASLSSACGLAGKSLFPALPVPVWGALHAVVAAALVASNRFEGFQNIMKALVGVMAVCVLGCAVLARPEAGEIFRGLVIPRVPSPGGGAAVLALVGGIGGSLTVICYGYWLRAAKWGGAAKLGAVRGDVGLAYAFTGIFGVALCLIAAGVRAPDAPESSIALAVASRLEAVAGPWARGVFLAGFWCTVFTAMLGVWQGVPHVYADLVSSWRSANGSAASRDGADRKIYLAALLYLAGPPLIMLWWGRPVSVVIAFSIVGAFFMPFLAATLLYMNNRRDWMGELASRRLGNVALVLCLLVFGVVCAREVVTVLQR